MPRSTRFPCRQAGCAALIDKPGYCTAHQRQNYRQQKQSASIDYKERNRFYQTAAWKRARQAQLNLEPHCRHCRQAGRLTIATHVDHINEISQGGAMLDSANLQSLCKSCHERKSGRVRAQKNNISQ